MHVVYVTARHIAAHLDLLSLSHHPICFIGTMAFPRDQLLSKCAVLKELNFCRPRPETMKRQVFLDLSRPNLLGCSSLVYGICCSIDQLRLLQVCNHDDYQAVGMKVLLRYSFDILFGHRVYHRRILLGIIETKIIDLDKR
jgi:hypothetical protein